MDEENKSLIKLSIAILAQAIIDTYLGSRSVRKKSREWFNGEGYKTVTNLLRRNGIRPQNIFDLSCSWHDIPKISKELLYIKCKAVNYLEETNENKFLLGRINEGRNKKLVKISTRKKKFKDFDALQLVNISML